MYTVYWYIPCEYLFESDSFSCGWLQAKSIKEEFDVRCGGPLRPKIPNKTTLISFYVYRVLFDELLERTGLGSRIIVSKYPEISHYNWLRDRLIEVRYNKNSQLGILNGDRVRLIEVTA